MSLGRLPLTVGIGVVGEFGPRSSTARAWAAWSELTRRRAASCPAVIGVPCSVRYCLATARARFSKPSGRIGRASCAAPDSVTVWSAVGGANVGAGLPAGLLGRGGRERAAGRVTVTGAGVAAAGAAFRAPTSAGVGISVEAAAGTGAGSVGVPTGDVGDGVGGTVAPTGVGTAVSSMDSGGVGTAGVAATGCRLAG